MEARAVDEAVNYAGEHNSTGLVILRGGRIVAEQYWQDWTKETSQPIFSSSKSIAAILVGMAIEDGKIKGVDQSASSFVNAWKDGAKSAITLRHMLSMTSGIKVGPPAVSPDVDAFEQTAALPLENTPGTVWAYNTPVYRMLIRILEIASGTTINEYTQTKLGGPIGMSNSAWQCGPAPGNKTNCTWYRSTLRDMSRFGLLISRHGKWENRQLIKPSFLKEATSTSQKLNEAYGYLWWLNGKGSYILPAGAQRRRNALARLPGRCVGRPGCAGQEDICRARPRSGRRETRRAIGSVAESGEAKAAEAIRSIMSCSDESAGQSSTEYSP
jgi:CubicO group peptidase (beta-lactamase class C family)